MSLRKLRKVVFPSVLLALVASSTVALRARAAKSVKTRPDLKQLTREEFNFRAQERFLPLFWRSDPNSNRTIDPEELAVLWSPQRATRDTYVDEKGFTPAFYDAYHALLAAPVEGKLPTAERERRALVRLELRGGRPTLVETDLRAATPEEHAVVDRVFAAAQKLEQIFARQLGTYEMASKVIAGTDKQSFAMFHRNQSPKCKTPQLENNAACTAIAGVTKVPSGLYPADIQGDAKFCDMLAAQPNGKALMDYFSTVVRDGAGFRAVPYPQAYPEEMKAIADELDAAAAAVTSVGEAPFKAYLGAAASSFRTNDWEPANDAWVKMSGSSSKWYLRIGPDEVYYEPCAWKAGFAVSFARINPDSKMWQEKLTPVKREMENALAKLAGPPYVARNVGFKLPDFIDMVLNSGDARTSHGATIGQSLPNWGPVADRGGRTVAMTNLYTDSDSREILKKQMSSLFCGGTDLRATTDPKPATMSTVLHEASHNLGPSHDYMVDGKKDSVLFGGPLASTLEELKAQTSALYFSEWLLERKLLTVEEAEEAHARDVAWAFGHISRGMYEGDGKPKNYSQLAAIQLGSLWKAGALVWKADGKAANGADQGCFDIEFNKWKAAVAALATRVLRVKARGDKADAEAMKAAFVDATDEWAKLKAVITLRWLRAPKATFVYSVR